VASLLGLPGAAQGASPEQALGARIAAELRAAGGNSGAWVADVDSGRPLFSLRADVRRTPASVQKLLTSSTALGRLGSDARMKTVVRTTGELGVDGVLDGDLYIQGFGDPSFGRSGLDRLAAKLRMTGIGQVTGRLYGDESYFDHRRGLPSGGFRVSRDVGPLSALSFNGGRLLGYGWTFQADPPSYVASRLRASLIKRGVALARKAREGLSPASARLLTAVRSPDLTTLVRHMNQVSDNYFAETMLKGLGARFGEAGSTAAGARVVSAFGHGLEVAANVLDGSGLSRGDAISPHAVGRLLLAAAGQPWFDPFYRSLPLAGHTGTLRKRMRGTAADGRCRAKTGTLIGVSALAGYCRSRLEHRIVFAVLMNGVNVSRARRAQDRIAAALASYSG
jgi:D-alanyl-D-alanine carboxypeptidase/D-alanyl-D-alanine-endopeptidase (penicillin-binding protein 4)